MTTTPSQRLCKKLLRRHDKNMKPVSFYLVTDTHYLDNKLEPGGKAFEKNRRRSEKKRYKRFC